MRANQRSSPLTCISLAQHMMAPVRGPSSRPQRRRRPSSTICNRSGSEAGKLASKANNRAKRQPSQLRASKRKSSGDPAAATTPNSWTCTSVHTPTTTTTATPEPEAVPAPGPAAAAAPGSHNRVDSPRLHDSSPPDFCLPPRWETSVANKIDLPRGDLDALRSTCYPAETFTS